MASKTVTLLLTENVDNLGIVGDVVNVRLGYARNYLLPREYATKPSDEMIESLKAKRAEAEKQLAELRESRKALISKLDGLEMTMIRACNDQGHLYGSVTQQDIAAALGELGFSVRPREVRLSHTIKRLDKYDVLVKFDTDLEANLTLYVEPDREMESDERDEMEFDNEGNLIEKPAASKAAEAKPEAGTADTAESAG